MQQSMHDRQRRTPLTAMFFMLVAASAAGAAEIHDAARAGDVEKVRAILRQDAKQMSALDEHGATPLHVAKDAATARVLLEAHAPLDVKDAEGRTPVDAAAADGRVEVAAEIVGNLVKTLEAIQRMGDALSGVKPGSADAAALAVQDRDLASLAAVIERNPDVVRQRTEKQKFTPLEFAVISHWVDGTRLLLERGADPNVKDLENHGTVLHETAAQGRDDVAVVLLDHGAKIDAKSDEGLTPLHAAAMEGKREMVRLLLMRGADTGAKVHGLTALQLARRGKHHDAVHFLELHEKLGQKRFAASIQLLSAAWRGDVAEIERIAGSDRELLSVRTEFGSTPLHKAVEGKQPLAVAALVRLGADPGAKADAGTTPLELAKDPETIAALQKGRRVHGGGFRGVDVRSVSGQSRDASGPCRSSPENRRREEQTLVLGLALGGGFMPGRGSPVSVESRRQPEAQGRLR